MEADLRVYLDTSALFTGIWSPSGGGRMILKLGELKAIQILLSSQVLLEIENVLRRKAPEALGQLAVLLDRSGASIVPPAGQDSLLKCQSLVDHPGDIQVIAAAWESKPDYFVTLDRKHFLKNEKLRKAIPFPMGTPSDFLDWFREKIA